MIGRDAELAELVQAWSRLTLRPADSAASRAAVITGDAGLGKSTLVSRAVAEFAPRPSGVLYGAARMHSPAPYDWLAGVLSRRHPSEPQAPPDGLAWLAQDPDAPRERYSPDALLRMAVRVVGSLVGAGPAVLVVEDLHALDPASLNLIAELAVAPLPALLLVTSQIPDSSVDAAASPRIAARVLSRLSGTPGAVRQHLSPLAAADVAELLGQAYPEAPVPAAVAETITERCHGNPHWLNELLAAAHGRSPEELAQAPMPKHLQPPSPAPAASQTPGAELTARESEVLRCLASGMSNKQIARSLGISVRTVTVHVSNLLRKTGAASRTEAALWAVRRHPA
ncbi:MAG: LuxR C-terminal-related transcriptional regulator [Micromonosporaceae bacterium]